MQKVNLFIFMFVAIFLINSTTAWTTGKQGSVINLSIESDADFCRLDTFKNSNHVEILNNISLTKINNNFNFSLDEANVSGSYQAQGMCDVTPWYKTLIITPSGNLTSTSQGIIAIVVILSVIFIMFFFCFVGFKLVDYEKLYGIGLFFLLLSIFLSVFVMYLGFTYSRDFMYATSTDPYAKLFTGTIFALVGISFLALLVVIINVLKEIKERKTMQTYGQGYNSKTKQYEY